MVQGEGSVTMQAMKLMYNISLIGIVTINPLLYNEYITIKILKNKKESTVIEVKYVIRFRKIADWCKTKGFMKIIVF
jgi:hypothetical protein